MTKGRKADFFLALPVLLVLSLMFALEAAVAGCVASLLLDVRYFRDKYFA